MACVRTAPPGWTRAACTSRPPACRRSSLPEGVYTLLPARYALLPGAVLVTATGNTPTGTNEMPGGFSVVSGYRYSALDPNRVVPTMASQFELAPGSVVRARAQYDTFFANAFFKQSAQA